MKAAESHQQRDRERNRRNPSLSVRLLSNNFLWGELPRFQITPLLAGNVVVMQDHTNSTLPSSRPIILTR